MALRSSSDLLNTPNNRNFLGLVELMARYDSVLMEHVSYVKAARHRVTYLSKDTQNELISLMGNRIRNTLIDRIKTAKYFSVILDCTFQKIKNLFEEDLLKNYNNFHILLQDGQISDIDGTDLFEELSCFIQVVPENNQSYLLDILKYLIELKLNLVYPNIYISVRILLTLPVTIATAERSFSKLKLIKNYLRSNTSQERLLGLAMMSIEREISHETDFSNVINDFASAKARKIRF
ncbi:hypothetical protein ALC62_12321 [Cyphomyrmex costatus]|uniref:HAT C-terminal dimerisation domain-containing protein n=1 Tax=Cyphomyrmex costatus TaxID=456900 RepID=A0A151IBX4_9HYME|nr:hypothetical protein ALC62_12321 [Cyphomyrmex costatus]